MPIARPISDPQISGRRYVAIAQMIRAPGQGVIDAASHDRGVGEQEIEYGGGDSQPSIFKVPPSNQDHARHNGEL